MSGMRQAEDRRGREEQLAVQSRQVAADERRVAVEENREGKLDEQITLNVPGQGPQAMTRRDAGLLSPLFAPYYDQGAQDQYRQPLTIGGQTVRASGDTIAGLLGRREEQRYENPLVGVTAQGAMAPAQADGTYADGVALQPFSVFKGIRELAQGDQGLSIQNRGVDAQFAGVAAQRAGQQLNYRVGMRQADVSAQGNMLQYRAATSPRPESGADRLAALIGARQALDSGMNPTLISSYLGVPAGLLERSARPLPVAQAIGSPLADPTGFINPQSSGGGAWRLTSDNWTGFTWPDWRSAQEEGTQSVIQALGQAYTGVNRDRNNNLADPQTYATWASGPGRQQTQQLIDAAEAALQRSDITPADRTRLMEYRSNAYMMRGEQAPIVGGGQ